MKYLIASDIHGSAYWCERLLEAVERENPHRVIFLGDILYHGPRNDLPRDYAPKKVIEIISAFADKCISVRGNCDTEVDQMVLPFPVLSDYGFLESGGHLVILSHGHRDVPPMGGAVALLCGHTHVPALEERDGYVYMNPGSTSIPKEGSANGYMTVEDGLVKWFSFDGGEYKRYKLGEPLSL